MEDQTKMPDNQKCLIKNFNEKIFIELTLWEVDNLLGILMKQQRLEANWLIVKIIKPYNSLMERKMQEEKMEQEKIKADQEALKAEELKKQVSQKTPKK